MSNDVVRWTTKLCKNTVENRSKQRAKYPPPAPAISTATVRSICDKTCEDNIKWKFNLRQHRNVHNDYDDDDDDDTDYADDEPLSERRKNVKIFVSNFIMKSICNRLVFLYILVNICNLIGSVYSDDLMNSPGARGHFTQQWAVHIPGGDKAADRVAADHGFINLGKIFDDHYHFHHNSVSKRSINPSQHHQIRLDTDDRVRWSKQQRAKSRQKRDLVKIRNTRPWSSILLNDPKWPLMWYLNRGNGLDMNVIPAWKEGITGKGVVVTILDDGLESTHPDLEANYDPKASYDVNSHDDDPMPHYDMTDSNRHGTRCAGEVAATANNSQCAVGIAFGARVGGVRMLDGDVTDAVEARSLSLNPQHIDIYSASWGPDDDGKTVDGPGELATRAFVEGITSGRNGKGSIFIWASGNGGRENDNCNCDGYTNSIWTLSISSATEDGSVPWYSEMCSSTLATTYSSGSPGEKQVVTTDLHHSCTSSHTGTSASAPLAAGIAALVLEANRNLTWRDLQHIVVRTAKPGNLKDSSWAWNGVARKVSHSFGYGLMDAAAMVKLARVWKTVPEQHRCEINAPHVEQIPAKTHITLQLPVKHCRGVNYLEHVQAKISLTAQRRGDIHIYLTSPAGTRVTLLTTRSHDVSRSGFNQWPFMSVHTWGEAPHGNWHLEIHNEGRYMAQIQQWDMIMYGTEVSAQPDDQPPPKKPTLESSGPTNSLDHNSLEFDTGTASGQWRNTQQVGESQHQRTTSSDLTSTACKTYSSDHKCIECQQNTYLYNGLCLSVCPDGTFIVPEQPMTKTKYRQRTDGDDVVSLSLRSDNNDAEFANLDDLLPAHNYTHKQPRDARIPQKYCADCHPNCLTCFGEAEMQCKTCRAGYHLITVSPGLLACQPNNDRLMEELDNIKTIKFNWDNLTIYEAIVVGIFLMLTILLLALGLYFVLKKFTCVCLWLCSHRKNDAGYSIIEMDEKSGLEGVTNKERQLQLLENDDDEDSSDDLD